MTDVIGRPPTESEKALRAALAHLTPTGSLDRLDAAAKYLIGIASTAGLVLTGFGAWPSGAQPLSSPVGPVLLFSLSLAAAVIAILPWRASVNLSNLTDVQAMLERRIRVRSFFVGVSGLLFASGLVAAPIALTVTKPETATTKVVLTATGGATVSLSGAARLTGIAPSSKVSVTVSGTLAQSGSADQTLFETQATADAAGVVEVTIAVADIAPAQFQRFTATVAVDTQERERLTVTAPTLEVKP